MVRLFAFSTAFSVLTLAAWAQPAALPQEDVTVTATKSREMLDKFAKAFTTPTKVTGKVARWEKGICPVAVGQQPAFTAIVTARVKAIAAATGAPVSDLPSCKPNIEIVFTSAPQELLDGVRENDPDYLGYAETSALREKLATVTRPIQAWYMTESVGLDGQRTIDSARRLNGGIVLPNFTAFAMPNSMGVNRDALYFPDATYARVTGNHINDGVRSGFSHIIIAVDTRKLVGQDFAPLADYIAMLALTQLNSLDTCQQLPSVVNMLAPGCDQRVNGITATDLAYLRGLYQMASDKSLVFQQNDIADRMEAALRREPVAADKSSESPAGKVSFAASAPQPETSAGNLPGDFYVKSSCTGPKEVTLPKPALTDRDNILLYNNAIRHHNKELEAFGACIDAYTGKASLDIDWILFTVNTAIAKANNANPPSAPAALGNMPSGFYPVPACTKPAAQPGAPPSVQDVMAMGDYNAKVKAYNVLAETFQACLKGYAAHARMDVAHIEQAQVAASQTKIQ